MKSQFLVRSSFIVSLVLICFNTGVHATGEFFTNATEADQRMLPLGVDSAILKRRLVRVNSDALTDEKRAGSTLNLNLFEDVSFAATVAKLEQRSTDNYTLCGSVNGDALSTFSLSVCHDVIALNVRTSGGQFYQVRLLQDGVYEARQANEDEFPECATKGEHAVVVPAAADAPIAAENDAGDIIDVMVVYTTAAKNAAGGVNAILASINLAISESNTAYQQSQINTQLRLVYATEVSYTESGFSTDLTRLTNPSDGFMDEVHGLRNTYGADLVSLWINDTSSCGIAWLMSSLSPAFEANGFSVVHWGPQCATGYYSFGHELGHNMGCAHDRQNSSSQGLYSYSYGWRFYGTNGVQYRTIMGYAPGTRIQRFSNPDVSYSGTPTGVPIGQANESNNAQTINNSASTVANFRTSITTSNSPPIIVSQPIPQSVPLGGTATFQVTAGGASPFSYAWQKDGTPISGATARTYSIMDAQYSDEADYSVIVSNAFGFVVSSNAPLTINTQIPLSVAVDNPGFPWLTGGTGSWIGQSGITHDGIDAAETEPINDNGYALLQTTIVGPGTLSFWWKVSSEQDFDYLDVFLDDQFLDVLGLTGEVDWTPRTFSIPSGTHTLTWQYSKDGSASAGQDKGWVDQITYTGSSAFSPNASVITNGHFKLTFTGLIGATYSLQSSTNLVDWTTVTNVINSSAAGTFLDPATGAARYYRISSP